MQPFYYLEKIMEVQLRTDVDVIKNFINSFSVAEIQKDIDDRIGWTYSEKTLVLAASKYALDAFVREKKSLLGGYAAINEAYFMITGKKAFMENKVSFGKIKIINKKDDMSVPYDFRTQCQEIINFNKVVNPVGQTVLNTKEEF